MKKYIVPIIAVLLGSFGIGCLLSVQILTYRKDHDVAHLYFLAFAIVMTLLATIIVYQLIRMHLRFQEQFKRMEK
jgi:hypothetical protein